MDKQHPFYDQHSFSTRISPRKNERTSSAERVLNVGTTSVLGVGKIKLSCVWAKVVTSLGLRSYKFR